jgi:hypothetical protein
VQLEESMDGMWEPSAQAKPSMMRQASGRGERPIQFNNCTFWGTSETKIRELLRLVLQQEAAAGPEGEPA